VDASGILLFLTLQVPCSVARLSLCPPPIPIPFNPHLRIPPSNHPCIAPHPRYAQKVIRILWNNPRGGGFCRPNQEPFCLLVPKVRFVRPAIVITPPPVADYFAQCPVQGGDHIAAMLDHMDLSGQRRSKHTWERGVKIPCPNSAAG